MTCKEGIRTNPQLPALDFAASSIDSLPAPLILCDIFDGLSKRFEVFEDPMQRETLTEDNVPTNVIKLLKNKIVLYVLRPF
jgi:hypothetical protein